jgi:hypothetical protein
MYAVKINNYTIFDHHSKKDTNENHKLFQNQNLQNISSDNFIAVTGIFNRSLCPGRETTYHRALGSYRRHGK